MQYPAKFTPDESGGFVVSFRDIPEALTQGDTIEEARSEAVDALVTAMDFYFDDGRAVPAPSAKLRRGEQWVALPASVASKVLLLNALVEKRMRPADLARAMELKPQEVTRIMDLRHATKIDTLADAFRAIGMRMEVVALQE